MSGRRRQNARRRNPPTPAPRPVLPVPTQHRWWNRATKSVVTAIVTLGAVAGAVSTIVSLWPSPDSDDSAEVTVRILPGIPLSEYQHRMESTSTIRLKAYNPPDDETTPQVTVRAEPSDESEPTVDLDPTEAPASSTPEPEPTVEPTSAPTDEPFPDPTTTPRPTDENGGPTPTEPAGLSSTGIIVEPPAVISDNSAAIDDAFEDLTGSPVPSDFIAIGNAISPSGEPVEPAVAAEQIAKVLSDARHAPSAADPAVPGPEPLGVVVSTDLDLSGLRGTPLTMSWSMWQESGGIRLSGDWLNDNLAYRIEPRSDHATTTLDVWIPMPREPGSYFVRVDLRSGQTRIDSGESERFE